MESNQSRGSQEGEAGVGGDGKEVGLVERCMLMVKRGRERSDSTIREKLQQRHLLYLVGPRTGCIVSREKESLQPCRTQRRFLEGICYLLTSKMAEFGCRY